VIPAEELISPISLIRSYFQKNLMSNTSIPVASEVNSEIMVGNSSVDKDLIKTIYNVV
jgi:hypothetical protein